MSDCLLGTKQIGSLWLPERHLGSSFESAMGWIVSSKRPSSNSRRKKKTGLSVALEKGPSKGWTTRVKGREMSGSRQRWQGEGLPLGRSEWGHGGCRRDVNTGGDTGQSTLAI